MKTHLFQTYLRPLESWNWPITSEIIFFACYFIKLDSTNNFQPFWARNLELFSFSGAYTRRYMVSLQQLGSPETGRPLYDDENTPLKALFQLIQLSQMHQNIHKSLENDI